MICPDVIRRHILVIRLQTIKQILVDFPWLPKCIVLWAVIGKFNIEPRHGGKDIICVVPPLLSKNHSMSGRHLVVVRIIIKLQALILHCLSRFQDCVSTRTDLLALPGFLPQSHNSHRLLLVAFEGIPDLLAEVVHLHACKVIVVPELPSQGELVLTCLRAHLLILRIHQNCFLVFSIEVFTR